MSKKVFKKYSTGCAHDCGGKCALTAYVKEGALEEIVPSKVTTELNTDPCTRGLHYTKRVYHPDRLRSPLKRIGNRGNAQFREIDWIEALDTVAEKLTQVKERYGSETILNLSGPGSYTATLHQTRRLATRFLNLFGGAIHLYGSYSSGAASAASKYTFGMTKTWHSRDDLLNSEMIILWGWNPAITKFGSDTLRYLQEAKHKGIYLVCVDPRYTTTAALSNRWLGIRPGTDVAMLSAMAYVIITDELYDRKFIDRFTVGFNQYKTYITGEEDGIPKTPTWASEITGVSAKDIRHLAESYAQAKAAALMPGWGPQRTAVGEQFTRACSVLAAITGNIGRSGTNPAGAGIGTGPDEEVGIPIPENPLELSIPAYKWADALLRGRDGGYPSNIKAAYCVGANRLGQHANVNKSVQALKKLEFFVVHEHFLTPTAKYADIVFPACTFLERRDILHPWNGLGRFILYQQQVITPIGECRTDLNILTSLADRLGFANKFNPKTEEQWLQDFANNLGIIDYEDFKKKGFFLIEATSSQSKPHIAFKDQIKKEVPFPTPSGKIEIYSHQLAKMENSIIPPIPKYIEHEEGITDPARKKYPLQLISPHIKQSINSTVNNPPETKRLVWINPQDAAKRNIKNGEKVRVFNHRGVVITKSKVTDRIIPGVVSLSQGGWYQPNEKGEDTGGCPNLLISDRPTPLSKTSTQNTALVEVEKKN